MKLIILTILFIGDITVFPNWQDKCLFGIYPWVSDKSYQACITPENRQGHCRYFSKCNLNDFQANFTKYLDSMCIIEQSSVGICCPDNAIKDENNNSTSTWNFPESLPQIADDADDDDIYPVLQTLEPPDEKVKNNSTINTKILSNRTSRRHRGCGMSLKNRIRIVGGSPADPRSWPWMAALIRPGTRQYCGGVLITDRHVLTAAHCFIGIDKSKVTVRLGEYDFTRDDETRALDFHITELKVHPNFDGSNYDNDIAIIKIHRPTIFNTYIWPICLPPVDLDVEERSAIVAGWGTQYYGGPASTILMEVPVPVWPQDKCRESMPQQISNNIICAGAYQGGRDSCQGDSGGPLLHQLADGRWVNIGIVSWGIKCGEAGYPGIYTKVSEYLDWIFTSTSF
ncbi:hypothetical protein HCN44_006697 [Aphidius gifuensis]|uniref:Phenoloxidase-activating factor 2 n=1 Tax=Aphidius gifuensis TaxID=684658 RepID=A0A834Y0M8_APHGI|nr:hypothetical protein HCN44_006697 [Aphidius gifuensis]